MAGRIEFDAGNEFAGSAPIPGPSTPAPAAEAPQADAGSNEQVEVDEAQVAPSSWADPDPNEQADEIGETKSSATKASDVPEVEVKGGKVSKKFKLAKDDPELTKTLQHGLMAGKYRHERDKLARDLKAEREAAKAVREKAQVWDQLDELARLGQHDKVARAVLGDANYEALRKEILREYDVTQNGDPDARYAYEKERSEREGKFTQHMYERKLQEAEKRLQDRDDQVESDRLRTLGTTALVKYDFRNFVEDRDLANQLNQKLWKVAWAELEEMSDDREVTPELVTKVFAENAKVLRGGMRRAVDAKVNQVIETKKQEAKRQATIAATERYPTGSQPDLTGWDGRNAKDLLKRLVGSRK